MSRSFSIIGAWADTDLGVGLAADVAVATPLGWRPAADLTVGAMLRKPDGPPVELGLILPAKADSWLKFPIMALGNRRAIVLGQGQSVLLKSDYIRQLTGEDSVAVPALTLKGWRGIHACAPPRKAVSLRLARPNFIMVGAGAFLACQGMVDVGWDALPPVPSLSVASAQQLLACLIAYDAGRALRDLRPQAAVLPD
jgi:hypothetical protein